ncbi:MAG TPA: hypothetical protein VJB39_03595 [Patescibacteria group bacterium]|nr:hypothetical protein [Patescibacteria group bacterium]
MKLNAKKIIGLILLLGLIMAVGALAQGEGKITDAIDDLEQTAELSRIDTGNDLAAITGSFINLFLSLLGALFLILVIYGGFTWMTAGGNEEKVKTATDLMTKAAIGLAIILSAYLLANFVVFKLMGIAGVS